MTAWVVAGPAGAGKSTLAKALAADRQGALLDLDTITNPLLDAFFAQTMGHWNDHDLRETIRPARYACLLYTAHAQAPSGIDIILAAPFTSELNGGEEWGRLVDAVRPHDVEVIWVFAPSDVLRRRIVQRAEPRDRLTVPTEPVEPVVRHLRVDGTHSTAEQLATVLSATT